jgi:hypothetical protein
MENYITLDDGLDYRSIARILTEVGYEKMNHATARNTFLAGLRGLLKTSSVELGKTLSEEEINVILQSPEVYKDLQEVLYAAHHNI